MNLSKPDRDNIKYLLEKHGFQKIRRYAKGYMCKCIFHDDRMPSFSINDEGLWNCFGCGKSGNWITLLKELGEKIDFNIQIPIHILNKYTIEEYDNENKENKNDTLITFEKLGYIPKYILNRINKETCYKFKLGEINGIKNRCAIPIFYKGKYVGYHSRAMENIEPKYVNSPGFKIKEHIFNYDNCEKKSTIYILEGAFNVMSMDEKGFKNCIATFGTKFTNTQIEKILSLNPKEINICFDNDSNGVGQSAAKELAGFFSELIDTYIVTFPKDKDPNQLTKEDIMMSILNKKKVEFQEAFNI